MFKVKKNKITEIISIWCSMISLWAFMEILALPNKRNPRFKEKSILIEWLLVQDLALFSDEVDAELLMRTSRNIDSNVVHFVRMPFLI